jgi:hypothetical protein
MKFDYAETAENIVWYTGPVYDKWKRAMTTTRAWRYDGLLGAMYE